MSSKSRKNSSPSARSKKHSDTAEAEPEEHGMLDIPDELIHAPKETSKLKFALMIGLVVLLLLIFAIPGALMGSVGGGGAPDEPRALVWERPGHGTETIYGTQLRNMMRGLDNAMRLDPFLRYQITGGDRMSQEHAARIYVLDALARDAGVFIPDESLGLHLKQTVDFIYGKDVDRYEQALRQVGVKTEEEIRRCLRVQRYMQIAGYAGALAHPDDIEKLWRQAHTESAYDYFAISSSEFEEAARTDIPDDEGLQAWFDELPAWEQNEFNLPEQRTAELAVYRDGETTPGAGLLASFPPADDVDLEEQANEYYNLVYVRRFAKTPEEDEEGNTPVFAGFHTFDEVRDRCLVEAPIYYAMQAWLEDIRTRAAAAEEVDFIAEASAHGLEIVNVTALTREELGEHAELGNPAMVNSVFATAVDAYSFLSMTKSVIGFGRVTATVESVLPPFAEIRDRVADKWVEPRAAELASEHAEGIWKELETFEPEEDPDALFPAVDDGTIHRRADEDVFTAAAVEAGHEVGRRDYLDRGGDISDDPDAEDEGHVFLRANARTLNILKDGEVARPIASGDGQTTYLVRLVGTREVPVDRMTPAEYESFKNQARQMASRSLITSMDMEFLEREYALELYPDSPDEEEGEGEEEEEG